MADNRVIAYSPIQKESVLIGPDEQAQFEEAGFLTGERARIQESLDHTQTQAGLINEAYGAAGGITAGALGVASGATLGLSDVGLDVAGVDGRQREKAEREHPFANLAGQLGGAVASAPLAGAGLAKAGLTGLKAAAARVGIYGAGQGAIGYVHEALNHPIGQENLAEHMYRGLIEAGKGAAVAGAAEALFAGAGKVLGPVVNRARLGLRETLAEAAVERAPKGKKLPKWVTEPATDEWPVFELEKEPPKPKLEKVKAPKPYVPASGYSSSRERLAAEFKAKDAENVYQVRKAAAQEKYQSDLKQWADEVDRLKSEGQSRLDREYADLYHLDEHVGELAEGGDFAGLDVNPMVEPRIKSWWPSLKEIGLGSAGSTAGVFAHNLGLGAGTSGAAAGVGLSYYLAPRIADRVGTAAINNRGLIDQKLFALATGNNALYRSAEQLLTPTVAATYRATGNTPEQIDKAYDAISTASDNYKADPESSLNHLRDEYGPALENQQGVFDASSAKSTVALHETASAIAPDPMPAVMVPTKATVTMSQKTRVVQRVRALGNMAAGLQNPTPETVDLYDRVYPERMAAVREHLTTRLADNPKLLATLPRANLRRLSVILKAPVSMQNAPAYVQSLQATALRNRAAAAQQADQQLKPQGGGANPAVNPKSATMTAPNSQQADLP